MAHDLMVRWVSPSIWKETRDFFADCVSGDGVPRRDDGPEGRVGDKSS